VGTALENNSIGARMRQARRAKGLTQVEFALLVDRSESWVRGVERGRLVLDKRSAIDRISEVLNIDVIWLLGQPYAPTSPSSDGGHRFVPALRTALRRTGLILSGHPGIPAQATPQPIHHLAERVVQLTRRRQAADLPGVMAALPEVVEALNTLILDGSAKDTERAHQLLVEVSHVARMVLNQLGHHDLAWSAVENAALCAAHLGDELLQASSAWDRCGVLLHTGSLGETLAVASAALNRLENHLARPSPEDLSLWGALQLRCAIAASRRHDATTAWSHLAEAEVAARRLGEDRNDFQTVFGPSNVQIHAVEIAVELGQPGIALDRAAPLDLRRLDSRERIVHHGIDIARSHGQMRQDDKAVRALRSAANLSPHYVHNHPMARALVTQLRQRFHPLAVQAGLGSLMRAMDLTS
jgi:transcriptional regulator with XRE-family HTH domain